MEWKKIGRAVLFPHFSLLIILLLAGTTLLVYSMLTLPEAAPIRIESYVLAFYTLTVWCVRIPSIIRYFHKLKTENKLIKTWLDDASLRTNMSLMGNAIWNGAYAALLLVLGVYHNSAWFYSLAAYYAFLAVMRFFLARHTLHHAAGENVKLELLHYRACGWVFLLVNIALSTMMFYLIHQLRAVRHNEITTIAMAAYTFTALTVAIINVVRYRRYNSPAMSAAKAISLAAACVSMLTLENTMLATFSTAEMTQLKQRVFLAVSGGAISVFIIVMAIYMIMQANRKIKQLGD